MGLFNQIAQYRQWKGGVRHCTFNPEGPGVVRIHLIPPRFRLFHRAEYIVILNGYYLLPLGYSWALLLSAFMDEVAPFDGKPIPEETADELFSRTVRRVGRVYPFVSRERIADDLSGMMEVLFTVARGGSPEEEIQKLSIRSYAKNMTAPHRMDLMISGMTDGNGAWKCNQKCLFCYAAGQPLAKGTRELSADEWKTAIARLRRAGVPMLTFTGGEPTLREDLVELVDAARWFVTRLNTNGINLTQGLCDGLRKASLDSVQITLYSATEEIHNSLVGAEHFADTVAGIRNALAAGLDVSVNTPLCRRNAEYPATLEFLHSLGVRYVTVSGLICTGMAERNHEAFDLSATELSDILRRAKEYCDQTGMEMDFTSPGLLPKETLESLGLNVPACGAALSNMAISPDGTVIPCQSWLCDGSGLGNILTDEWKTVWDHSFARSLRGMSEAEALSCPFRKRGAAERGEAE